VKSTVFIDDEKASLPHSRFTGVCRSSGCRSTVTPSTVYTVNGSKSSLGSLQKGMHVNVQHNGLTATRIDAVP
jgi:hypothetical protein